MLLNTASNGMSKKFIIANWKMNPESLAQVNDILDSVTDHLQTLSSQPFFLIFCPPFIFIEEVSKTLQTTSLGQRAELGAQDIAMNDDGALTGEVSGPMLVKLGVRYVIVGHSERRWKLGESDEVVNQKIRVALRSELVPIVCLGERARDEHYQDFLREQTKKTFKGLSSDEVAKCIIAYEPVWAISTTPGARPDTPESALDSVRIIRDYLANSYKLTAISFLYGGSITSANVADFLALDEFYGTLVGGASINREEFVKILEIAARHTV